MMTVSAAPSRFKLAPSAPSVRPCDDQTQGGPGDELEMTTV